MTDLSRYTIGWICAIDTEYTAARAFLDETHERPEAIPVHDNNAYTLGRIGKHNVVIVVLPDGEYGLSTAGIVAQRMLGSFPNVRVGLMVGIGGGAPIQRPGHDIRLGDVVVSSPRDGHTGVLQYDFGKTIQDQGFKITRSLNLPPDVLRAAVTELRVTFEEEGSSLPEAIHVALSKKPKLRRKGICDYSDSHKNKQWQGYAAMAAAAYAKALLSIVLPTKIENEKRLSDIVESGLQGVVDATARMSRRVDDEVLNHLTMAKGAAYDSGDDQHEDTCLPGTRAELLKNIKQWAQDPKEQRIYWLKGMADECTDDRDVKGLVVLLSKLTERKQFGLKIFITSRPDVAAEFAFGSIDGFYQEIILQEVEKDVIDHDIGKLLASLLTGRDKKFWEF
ncbi:hypothetical protein KHU50_002837 [Colletotrichum sp. SAR 10_65]|nr:hypothetical protein KHU50_002837 [Colletotrichum sp. SAR 10_65]